MEVDIPDQNQQRVQIKELLLIPSRPGDRLNLISQKWWNYWKSWVSYDGDEKIDSESTPPQAIDNTDLLENGNLKQKLIEGENYAIIVAQAWEAVSLWYGGGPAIVRTMIEIGETTPRTLQVEVYLLRLVVVRPDSVVSRQVIEMSRTSKVKQLIHRVAQIIYTAPHNCHLKIDTSGSHEWKLITNEQKELSLDEIGIVEGTLLFGCTDPTTDFEELDRQFLLLSSGRLPMTEDIDSVEDEDDDDMDTEHAGVKYVSTGTTSSSHSLRTQEIMRYEPGVTGLHNLGNTCFMNSALQCLSNTDHLTKYFLNDDYQPEINRSNNLGTGGKLADEYGKLMKKIWKGAYNYVSPSEFKWAVGRHATQFEGYRQHDSQELLAYLLDGLHEDLNRVRNKPYVTLKDSDGRPDSVLAAEAWEAHLQRNKSIIVDLFHGQLKSTVICPDPDCGHVSITFDPFVYLSLPLPVSYDRSVDVVFVSMDVQRNPKKYRLRVDKRENIIKLKEALININPEIKSTKELIVADIYNNSIFKVRLDDQPLDDIRAYDVTYVYHLTPRTEAQNNNETEQEQEIIHLHVSHRVLYASFYVSGSEVFGTPKIIPFVISKDHVVSVGQLYLALAEVFYYEGKLPAGVQASDILQFFTLSKSQNMSKLVDMNDQIRISSDEKFTLTWKNKQSYLSHNSIMENIDSTNQQSEENNEEEGRTTLHNCLKKFHEAEKLGKSDEWFCSKCKTFKQAIKKFDLWKIPKVLVIHLKRFQYSKYNRNKISTFIDFPLHNLDLTQYQLCEDKFSDPPMYDLFAVSVHSGGLGGGHYTAYALNTLQNKWFSFNDSYVTPCQPSDVVTSGAYVLFYKRREETGAGMSETSTTTTTTTSTVTTVVSE